MRQNQSFNDTETLRGWLFVFLSFILMLCLGTVYSYSVFRNPIETTFLINTTFSGLPYMFALAFYALSMFVSGHFIQRYHPRFILFIGSLIVSMAYILSSFSTNIILLTLTYGVLGGIGVGLMYGVPIQNSTIWFNQRKGFVVGIILIGFGLSPLLSAPIGSYLIDTFGLMKSFLYIGLFLLIFLPIIVLLIPLKYEKSNVLLYNKKTESIIHTNEFKGLYVNFVIGTMIGLMLVGLTSKVGLELFVINKSAIALLMGIFALLNGLGRPIFGYVVDRFSIKRAMTLSYSLIIVSTLILLVFKSNHPIIFMISFSIYWLNLGAWLSIAPSATRILFGMNNYSRNYGLVFTGYGVGAILGIILSGLIMDIFQNYSFVFIFILFLSSFGLVFALYSQKK